MGNGCSLFYLARATAVVAFVLVLLLHANPGQCQGQRPDAAPAADAPAEPSLQADPEANFKAPAQVSESRLAVLDWLVIGGYAAGMLAIGWYYSRRTNTTEEYLLGGRRMKPMRVGLSLFATLISTISYLSVPGETIANGPVIFLQMVGFPFALLVVGWYIIPRVMKLKITSAYELLELRLGRPVRLTGSLLFLTLRLLWMGLIVYATTEMALIPFMGIDPRYAPLVSVVLCVATMVYTSMGGIRAVVLTDALQSIILFAAAIASVVFVTYQLGGLENWWPHTWPAHWQPPKFWFDPTVRLTVTGVMLNGFLWYMCTNGSDQMAIQRFLSTRDASAARRVMAVAIAADAVVLGTLGLLGLALLAFFRVHGELLPSDFSIVAKADQLFPIFIVDVLPAGVTGFVIAGLLSAAMSSLSSGLSAATSVIMADLLGYSSAGEEGGASGVRFGKWITLGVGAVVIVLSLFVSQVQGNLVELGNKIAGLLTAPLFLLFVMALWVPWATPFGTLVGVVVSTAVAVEVSILGGLGLGSWWIDLSFLWILPLSLGSGVIVAMLASLLPIGPKAVPLDEISEG